MTDQGAGAAVAAEPLVSVVIAVYNGQDLVGCLLYTSDAADE